MTEVYVVQYHSNAWGDQMSSDDILGIYDSEDKANERANKFKEKYAYDDDIVSVDAYTVNDDYDTMYEAYDHELEES